MIKMIQFVLEVCLFMVFVEAIIAISLLEDILYEFVTFAFVARLIQYSRSCVVMIFMQ